jgi:hypothetical protein
VIFTRLYPFATSWESRYSSTASLTPLRDFQVSHLTPQSQEHREVIFKFEENLGESEVNVPKYFSLKSGQMCSGLLKKAGAFVIP